MGMSGQIDKGMQIDGATDNTAIGNVGDRLKVDVAFSGTGFSNNTWTSTLSYDDMNVSNGGIARKASVATSTNWTTTYARSGSGNLGGIVLTLETFVGWEFRLVVDGTVVFSFVDTDITTDSLYDLDDPTFSSAIGLSQGAHNKFIWHPPLNYPLRYSTSVTVQVRRPIANAKKFEAGLVILSKDT